MGRRSSCRSSPKQEDRFASLKSLEGLNASGRPEVDLVDAPVRGSPFQEVEPSLVCRRYVGRHAVPLPNDDSEEKDRMSRARLCAGTQICQIDP